MAIEVEYRFSDPAPIKLPPLSAMYLGQWNVKLIVENEVLVGFVGKPTVIAQILREHKVKEEVIDGFWKDVMSLCE